MKIFRNLGMALLAIGLGLVQTACGGDHEPTQVNVDVSSLTFSADGESQSFKVTSNTKWTITGNTGWLQISPATGDGDRNVVATAQMNNSVETRTCTLTIITDDGNDTASIRIEQKGIDAKLSVDVQTINLDGKANSTGQFYITSNTEWRASTSADWLTLSSTSDTGNSSIIVTAKSDNNSPSSREATINISGTAGNNATIKITQLGLLTANCRAIPTHIVTLATSMANDYNYESNVAYYFSYVFSQNVIERYTDAEIIEALNSVRRDTPSDSYIQSWSDLSPLTQYVICTIAYDKNGNRGELVKTTFKTKNGTNQPYAGINNVRYNSSTWKMDVTVNPAVDTYYVWRIAYSDLWSYPDPIIAWLFTYAANNEKMGPYKAGGSFEFGRNGEDYFHAMTWAIGLDGEWSGEIGRYRGRISNANKINIEQPSIIKTELVRIEKNISKIK